MIRKLLFICLFGALLTASAAPARGHGHGHGHGLRAGGFLFVGTDTEEFEGAMPNQLGRFQTYGPSVVSGTIIPTSFPINGMGDAHGFLYSGDPFSNVIRRISYDGSLLGSTAAAFPSGCCSEDMILAGRFLYHAHYPSTIEKIDPTSGALVQTYPQRDVVGMTFVTHDRGWSHHRRDKHRQIWISKWNARQVGVWDPATNTFTPRFATPNLAGGLAWDPRNEVLWVGLRGGLVVPYRLSGTPFNSGFLPFGPISGTIDGLEFVRGIHVHHHHDNHQDHHHGHHHHHGHDHH